MTWPRRALSGANVAIIDELARIRGRMFRRWWVTCDWCGRSPTFLRSETEAVRVRWEHELEHSWPDWMTRRRDGAR